MALASLLESAGSPAVRINTDAEVTIRRVEGTPTTTDVDLVTVGMVLGVDEVTFAEHALNAKANCRSVRALATVPEVNLVASLERLVIMALVTPAWIT